MGVDMGVRVGVWGCYLMVGFYGGGYGGWGWRCGVVI